MPVAVVGDAAETVADEEVHLVFEGIGGERPAVGEDDGLAGASVVVIEGRAVFGGEDGHDVSPCCGKGERAILPHFG
jgi:hypothetical protein